MANQVAEKKRREARTGTVVSFRKGDRTVWAARILLKDGSRRQLRCPVGFTRPQAEAKAKEWQAKEDATHGLLLAKQRAAGKPVEGETADAWHRRMLPVRAAHTGHGDSRHHAARWENWVSPILGAEPVASLEREHALAVRDSLDLAISGERITAKTARNVWSTFCVAMRIAASTKTWARSVQVLATNIAHGVEAPENGTSRLRQWIFPSEFAALMACAAVPVERRRLYALASYTGLRPGELAELRHKDVDATAGLIRVRRALDRNTMQAKTPKTASGIREVPIADALYPLLGSGAPEELVAPLLASMPEWTIAGQFRTDLKRAGVDAPRLFESTETHLHVDFRCLRDSCATWWAISGLDIHRIMRRLGHSSVGMSLRYAKAAEVIGPSLGAPFGPLPAELSVTSSVTKRPISAEIGRPQGDSNPR